MDAARPSRYALRRAGAFFEVSGLSVSWVEGLLIASPQPLELLYEMLSRPLALPKVAEDERIWLEAGDALRSAHQQFLLMKAPFCALEQIPTPPR